MSSYSSLETIILYIPKGKGEKEGEGGRRGGRGGKGGGEGGEKEGEGEKGEEGIYGFVGMGVGLFSIYYVNWNGNRFKERNLKYGFMRRKK